MPTYRWKHRSIRGHTLRVLPTFCQFLVVRTDQDQAAPGAFPRPRSQIGRRALFNGAHGIRSRRICKGWSETERWNVGPARASARVKENCARAGMRICTSQRPRQRKPRARWNVGPARASARVKETARDGMRKNSTRARVKETARARECLQNPVCE
jgi:hypothetical protein